LGYGQFIRKLPKHLNPLKMKKLVLTWIAAAAFLTASAQIEKNTVLFGGSSNLNFSTVSPSGGGTSESLTQISFKTGYFLAENMVLGLNFNYLAYAGSSTTALGAFGRYYPGGKFFVGAGYLSRSSTGTSGKGEFNAEAGYALFITRSVAVEPALNYISGDGFSSIGLNVGFSLYLNRGDQ
jgi:hypothetical protein